VDPILPALYLISHRRSCHGRRLEDVVASAVHGGVRLVQLREKDLPDDQYLQLAVAIRRVLKPHDGHLFLNNRPHLAELLGASGIQRPWRGTRVMRLRAQVPAETWIGVSVHSIVEAHAALAEDPDFLLLAPVFSPGSKPGFRPGIGLGVLAAVCRDSHVPVYALGGITPDKVEECVNAGAHGIAVCSGIMGSQDPSSAASLYLEALADAGRYDP
jgi:thiamine-phosphate pyrophosphorylase